MNVKQVVFSCSDADTVESTKEQNGGIAFYDDYNHLQGVICGCCGGIFEANEVTIIRTLDWLSISEEIIGE